MTSEGRGLSSPIKVPATGTSLRSDSVTISVEHEGVVGLCVQAHYGTATAWLTQAEAEQVAAALLAQFGGAS